MKKVQKGLVEKLIKNYRIFWQLDPFDAKSQVHKCVQASSAINDELRRQVDYDGFCEFDDLANLVARNNLTNEQYYEMLKICGVEVE